MIHLLSQPEADRQHARPSAVQNISPYVNPAHVLSPPRHWLEALSQGRYSWALFRFRYKTLLRSRFKEEPERFFALLAASKGVSPLFLTCHCTTGPCHREAAREFLEALRKQYPQSSLRAARNPVRPSRPEIRRSSTLPHPSMILTTLIEHPVQGSKAGV